MAQQAAPPDLLFFLREEVFPQAPRELVEEALSCSRLALVSRGSPAPGRGLYIVYSGSIRYRGRVYERGDYVLVDEPSGVEPVDGEAVVLVVEERCARGLLRLAPAGEGCRIGDLVHREPVTVEPSTPLIEAVRLMDRNGVSSVVVVDGEGRPVGIFTDTDLRRLVAGGRFEPGAPIERFMTRDPYGLPPYTLCSDAVYRMMEWNVKHLLVVDRGRLHGVVTVRDIAYAEALGPLYVRRLMRAAGSVEALREAYQRLVRVLARFAARLHPLSSGAEAAGLVRMASLALRSVVEAAARIAGESLGVVDARWSLLVMGSNARLEQAWPTDRDTALVYDAETMSRGEAVRLGDEVERVLDEVGFPGCSHGHTARRHVYSLGELLSMLREAGARPGEGENLVIVGLFMDAVDAYSSGGLEAGGEARRVLAEAVASSGSRGFVRSALAMYRPRLGPLGRLPRRLDLKRDGLAPIVFAVKALTLYEGVWKPVSTLDRLEALSARGALPGDLAAEAAEAYRVLLGFSAWSLAVHGSREVEAGELSGVERSLLRSALQAAQRLVDRVRG
ncbi:MAG: CBS domain-containing protein [Crenarchaeota archaeon]|nr:CBS domain-containing protein [Thermoproteota archaeon]